MSDQLHPGRIPAVGESIPVGRVTVDADKIKMMALILRDPNPIHFDRMAVRTAGLGEVEVNQAASTMAYVFNTLISWTGSRSSIRAANCRFLASVVAGDEVQVGGSVTAVRRQSGEDLVDCDIWADRADGVRAISGSATVAFIR